MIFIGKKPLFKFKTKKSFAKKVYECGLTNTFNLILHSNNTGLIVEDNFGEVQKVCFVVPTHFASFLKTFEFRLEDWKKCFEFENENDECEFGIFVRKLKDRVGVKIPDLK